jgi:selenocysteine lyase/cysteine desulfurase
MDRRRFIRLAGLSASSELTAPSSVARTQLNEPEDVWKWVRSQFRLSSQRIHMSAMLLTSHPRPVRDAIDRHREGLDADPIGYLEANFNTLHSAAISAAARYLGVGESSIALTESTTMGIGLVYNGLRIRRGDEILISRQSHLATFEAARLAALKSGARLRQFSIHDDVGEITAGQIVSRVVDSIRPQTRVLGLTWVQSSTGLKIPVREIATAIAEINQRRTPSGRILLCLDAVHGFGNQDVTLDDLGCDFLMAGCHKWLFGPRGTGIVAAGKKGWQDLLPTIPSFVDAVPWSDWHAGRIARGGVSSGAGFTPGGFKAFEHGWALAQAFEFHERIGKAGIAARTNELSARLKVGLQNMAHVELYTPLSSLLSAGIVAFDVVRNAPAQVVRVLSDRGIVASVSPYATPHVRLTPSIQNSLDEVDRVLAVIAEMNQQ